MSLLFTFLVGVGGNLDIDFFGDPQDTEQKVIWPHGGRRKKIVSTSMVKIVPDSANGQPA